jgi:hypothetical protein
MSRFNAVLGAALMLFGVSQAALAQSNVATTGPSYILKNQKSGSNGSHGNNAEYEVFYCNYPSNGGNGGAGPTVSSSLNVTSDNGNPNTIALASSTGGNGGSGGNDQTGICGASGYGGGFGAPGGSVTLTVTGNSGVQYTYSGTRGGWLNSDTAISGNPA